mmetsp:Transcript_18307/g.30074  ORF Transcript_18307/g.30074 Transcript_18307/m.30074 type:complete len:778 (-) Transcript_18307:503-2836(-)|eukprot:CAMPEP_0184658128 /NCGR_PEP_ID=MMETSP0308-20130426/23648_1 /TAXON_ID=38269 /ORGANISM="Gloeochaete witrockiana, Strain SAG 46.84" /LENGTH=777 /DNA_ID=CAMNT_0027096783 /DNA_START=49 /DNA_END=2382 /DNA_ORIENTATION=+
MASPAFAVSSPAVLSRQSFASSSTVSAAARPSCHNDKIVHARKAFVKAFTSSRSAFIGSRTFSSSRVLRKSLSVTLSIQSSSEEQSSESPVKFFDASNMSSQSRNVFAGCFEWVKQKVESLPTDAARRAFLAAALAGTVSFGATSGAMADVMTASAPAATMQMETTTTQTDAAATPTTDAALLNRENWIYSQFIEAVEKHDVERVTFSTDMSRAVVVDVDGNRHKVALPPFNSNLLSKLAENGADVAITPPTDADSEGGIADLLTSLIIPGIFIGVLFFLARGSQGGAGGMGGGPLGRGNPLNVGRSTARFQMEPSTGVTFKDVAGIANAKLELEEVVDFLKDSTRYTAVGARIPRGVILTGPPGTGKTLLARAVAGEAGVPFFSISGSEFVEMFVGVGASRVRDLFTQAKQNAPCIIFIDEIDAVGRSRGGGGNFGGGGNDEREQTLNQMLTEMDGFEGNTGVIVIAATNRLDVLDSALLRPGRFDRQVMVDLPDFKERRQILDVHARGKPLEETVNLDAVARRTPGFSGASLANLLNEAAILSARRKKTTIGAKEIDDALDRIIIGAEKTDRVITEKVKKLVAYHESGHALVGAMMADYDAVSKVSIIPRGGAGGLTFFSPDEERIDSGMYSRKYLVDQMAVALGGRVAEEIVFGGVNITTGASNDIMQVTNIARRMVTQFGMSKKIGPIESSQGGMFSNDGSSISPQTQDLIDSEVRDLVNGAYERATAIITEHRAVLDQMAEMLMEKETIDAEDVKKLVQEIVLKRDQVLTPA